jgi:hypothetical protein
MGGSSILRGPWAIVLPLGFVEGLAVFLERMDFFSGALPDYYGTMQLLGLSLAMLFSLSFLIQGKTILFSGRPSFVSFLGSLVFMVAVGTIGALCLRGFIVEKLLAVMIPYVCSASITLLGLFCAASACRKRFTPVDFIVQLFIWLAIPSSIATSVGFGVSLALPGGLIGGLDWFLFFVIICGPVLGIMLATILWLVTLPFICMAYLNPYYRDRFDRMLTPQRLESSRTKTST